MPPSTPKSAVAKQEFKKHVAAIHTTGDLSLLERKLVNVLLLNAYDNLNEKRNHAIPLPMLCSLLGWDSNDQDHLRRALVKIVTTPVEFNLMEVQASKEWSISTLLAQAEIKNGVCSYEYSSKLASRLHDPDIYAIINIGIQRQFNSRYSLTLYENCLRFKKTGSTGWIELDRFKKLMGATTPVYDQFKYLSNMVISKAVEEVNLVSDITISPEFKRVARKVTEIRFLVQENVQQTIFDTSSNKEHDQIRLSDTYKRLVAHGIGEKLAIVWILQDEDRAKLVIDYVEEKGRKNQVKGSTGGYIRTLIEDETVTLGKSEFERKTAEDAAKQKELESQLAAGLKSKEDEDFARAERKKRAIKALTLEELQRLAEAYNTSEGIGKCKSYKHDTATYKNAQERILFTSWLRGQMGGAHTST